MNLSRASVATHVSFKSFVVHAAFPHLENKAGECRYSFIDVKSIIHLNWYKCDLHEKSLSHCFQHSYCVSSIGNTSENLLNGTKCP